MVLCAHESVKAKSVGCFGMALTMAFTFYMVVFHSLSNLPLDQPLYFEVCPASSFLLCLCPTCHMVATHDIGGVHDLVLYLFLAMRLRLYVCLPGMRDIETQPAWYERLSHPTRGDGHCLKARLKVVSYEPRGGLRGVKRRWVY